MNSRHMPGFAVVLGGAVAIVGAALLNSPLAYADEPPSLPFGIERYPYISPPGNPGEPTDSEVSGIPYLLWNNQETVPYTITEAYKGVVGEYIANQDNSLALPVTLNGSYSPGIGLFLNEWLQVIDSTGAAPAVGTVFDDSAFAIPVFNPVEIITPPLPILQNFYESDPTGTTQDLFQVGFFPAVGNYISIGPAGLLDELTFQGVPIDFAIPILNIPFTAPTAAVEDAGSLWSDIAALF